MKKISFSLLLISILALSALFSLPYELRVYAADDKVSSGKTGKEVFSDDGSKGDAVVFRKTVPKIRKIAVSGDKTRIKWKEIEGASCYAVYRSASAKGRYRKIGKTSTLSYKDASGESGKVYYYKVRAYDEEGNHTKYSKAKKFKTVFRVYIACGHGTDSDGRWDPGCIYNGLEEARLMLPITQDFVKYMRGSGVYVYTDADTGNNMNRDRCIAAANKKRISAYVSVHCDWDLAPSGTIPMYLGKDGKKLAKALNKGVHTTVRINDRGLVRRSDLLELSRTKVPACTFETGSIRWDSGLFRKKHDAYGKGLAMGLCKYLGIDFIIQ